VTFCLLVAGRGCADPLPLGFSQVLILKVVKVLCFHTLLQVLILNLVSRGPWEDAGALAAIARAGLKTAATYGENPSLRSG
jgi:hypothetical protein